MYAGEHLDWLRLVDLIIIFAVFHWNREDSGSGHRFEGHGWRRVQRTDSQNEIVRQIDECSERDDRSKATAGDLGADHPSEYSRMIAGYSFTSTGVPILWLEPKRL